MTDILSIVEAFYECDISEETTREIMHDLLDNCGHYDEEAIDEMLRSKLSIDSYIALRNYFSVGL